MEDNTVTERMIDILNEVARERVAQIEKWGAQRTHPDSNNVPAAHSRGEGMEALARRDLEANGNSWEAILLEEVAEALGAIGSEAELRAELVQVSAVAAAWIQAIDERGTQPDAPAGSQAAVDREQLYEWLVTTGRDYRDGWVPGAELWSAWGHRLAGQLAVDLSWMISHGWAEVDGDAERAIRAVPR